MDHHSLRSGRLICFLLIAMFCPCESQVRYEPHCLWSTRLGPCMYCERGWFGDRCDYRCTNCDIGGCRRHNGTCYQCAAGYFSPDCTTTCPQHCGKSYHGQVYCYRTTGKCLDSCQFGWWGDWCRSKCSDRCVDNSCFFLDGSCEKGCESGWSGEMCDVKCPDNCGSTNDGKANCDQKTRDCLSGCKHGWWGDLCSNNCTGHCFNNTCHHIDGSCPECQNGWTGNKCDVQCPQGCLHDTCNRYNSDRCTHGCQRGFHGEHCNQTCPTNCADQDCFFNHSLKSVTCRHGCTDDWWSHYCQNQCHDNCTSCHRESGNCLTPKFGITVKTDSNIALAPAARSQPTFSNLAIVLPMVILISIIAGLFLCFRRRKSFDAFDTKDRPEAEKDRPESFTDDKATLI